jgi:hypothetical protein
MTGAAVVGAGPPFLNPWYFKVFSSPGLFPWISTSINKSAFFLDP